ncbi:hypothetical protein BC940DRAFT_329401 [Gongronella butleri]|nr:hypothetical protein BC940DRAFT_329401 [Gongronella butleri]
MPHYNLAFVLAVWLASVVWSAPAPASFEPSCQPNESCWPTEAEWQAFNASIGGHLIPVIHPGQQCFPGAHLDLPKCLVYESSMFFTEYRSSEPALTTYSNWMSCGDSSLVCPTLPVVNLVPQLLGVCKAGNIPAYAVVVLSADDVSKAVVFAKQHRLAVNIKNTGHDLMGRNTSPNSLTLWTHKMTDHRVVKNFQPEQCPDASYKGPAMTMAAGVKFEAAFQTAQKSNVNIIGPFYPGIGTVGGWMQGSGYGVLSNTFGVASDLALEYKVVLADGSLVVANECQHPDLFWALRGGGGGTFGVVVEATAKVIEGPLHLQGVMLKVLALDLRGLMLAWSEQAERLADDGWSSYNLLYPEGIEFYFANAKLTKEEGDASFQKFVDAISKFVIIKFKFSEEYDNYLPYSNEQTIKRDYFAGFAFSIGTRLMPRSQFKTPQSREELIDTYISGMSRQKPLNIIVPDVIVTVNTPIRDDGGAAAYNPRWRKEGLWLMDYVTIWIDGVATNSDTHEYNKAIGDAATKLGAITHGGPISYSNEADYNISDWQTAFWGEHYPRLLDIKHKYDPDMLFRCWKCVGWTEEMAERDPKFKCYKTF